MREIRSASVSAPAKLNLGLEILGKRDDGYHELRTVMAMIDLVDSLTITPVAPEYGIRIGGVPGVSPEDNLIGKAIRAFTDASGICSGYDVVVTKAIPSPGGLGGASSDAAATLLALDEIHGKSLSPAHLTSIARSLGADVPFFLGSPCALASGTGTTLRRLPPVRGWVVLVVPSLSIGAKTPTLYRALRADDFSDGSRVSVAADTISNGQLPSPESLSNAFERPLYAMAPRLQQTRSRMLAAGAPFVALSGAGPAHYTLFDSQADARAFAASLPASLPDDTLVTLARFLLTRPAVEVRAG